ncbi:hypothetical protein J5N97_009497 [Dioscorea zingiberensis]|uniref:U-box domain-containing protein n=1 Tax=Dioscorea zingiberensis TaxID=325984 RepID=A0A9D5HMR3_9LILI|nr:hypothetical protein J5N97_009497 [Dioscorea zingiberensis]
MATLARSQRSTVKTSLKGKMNTSASIPVTPMKVEELLSGIALASRRGDQYRCGELVAEMKRLVKESQRNRQYITEAGTGRVLSSSFELFSRTSVENSNNFVLEEILSVLSCLFPLDEEALRCLSSPESMNSIISILKSGRLSGRLNAVKASLAIIFHLISSNEKNAIRFVEMNLVSMLLEILVDSEKSMCERVLVVLDGVLSYESGMENARLNALVMPVLVKKMFRVSEMATELAVSALWKLCCKKEEEDGKRVKCLIECLQFGAFQKLLLLLQVGCSERTKEKATELLRLLNGYRAKGGECIDSMDFKGIKRAF